MEENFIANMVLIKSSNSSIAGLLIVIYSRFHSVKQHKRLLCLIPGCVHLTCSPCDCTAPSKTCILSLVWPVEWHWRWLKKAEVCPLWGVRYSHRALLYVVVKKSSSSSAFSYVKDIYTLTIRVTFDLM